MDALCDWYLLKSKRVAFLIGSRGNDAETAKVLLEVAEKFCIPVSTTLSGIGAFPEAHILSLGVYGFSSHSRAARVINSDELDALVVFGSDLNQRDSMNWSKKLTAGKELTSSTTVLMRPRWDTSRVAGFCPGLAPHPACCPKGTQTGAIFRRCWKQERRGLPRITRYRCTAIDSNKSVFEGQAAIRSLHPGDVVKRSCQLLSKDSNVVVDSGAHRIFMAHYWLSSGIGNYFSSSSLTPMGWAIAAGIGVKLAAPERPCVVVTGDGCMLMYGMEIQTAARYRVKIIYGVLNNSAHGAIHIDAISNGSISEQFSKLPRHDWTAFAMSLCVASRYDGPFLVEVATGVFPEPNRYYAECATCS